MNVSSLPYFLFYFKQLFYRSNSILYFVLTQLLLTELFVSIKFYDLFFNFR
nr:MAG TPA: hypothetical protein [Caudoviricetes sp.]